MRVIIKRNDGTKVEPLTLEVAKSWPVTRLKKAIQEEWGVKPEAQRLFFGGKILEGSNLLLDFGLDQGKVIQFAEKRVVQKTLEKAKMKSRESPEKLSEKPSEKSSEEPSKDDEEEVVSDFYLPNDVVDCKSKEHGYWYEAYFVKAVKKDGKVICKVKYISEDEVNEVPEENVRPMSKRVLYRQKLQVGQIVLVNYNFENPGEFGELYDFKIAEIALNRTNTVLHGFFLHLDDPIPKIITVKYETYAIETPKKVAERGKDLYQDDGTWRELPPCPFCKADDNTSCSKCHCVICNSKEDADELLICDECEDCWHIYCLKPKLKEVPDEEWYCSECATNRNEIYHEGEKVKAKEKQSGDKSTSRTAKEWGGGFACVGRREICDLPKNHQGPVPGVEVGSSWVYRFQVSEAGIHRPIVSGIHGRETDCAYSLVLAGGYEDDEDNGDSFEYTGAGGRDLAGNKRTNVQSCDQKLTRSNKALAINCNTELDTEKGAEAEDWKGGIPVRVVRSHKILMKHKNCPYAPTEGYRYDGIYKVVSYRPVKGKSGFIVWRYLLKRDDPSPAPWTKEGKKMIKELGLTLQRPEENGGMKRKATDSEDDGEQVKKKKKGGFYKLPEDVMALIEQDTQNEKKWADLIPACEEGQLEFMEKVKNEFTCPVCVEVMNPPVTTPCQHNICQHCVKTTFETSVDNPVCPVCRHDLPLDIVETGVNVFLHKILLKLSLIHGERKTREPKIRKRRKIEKKWVVRLRG